MTCYILNSSNPGLTHGIFCPQNGFVLCAGPSKLTTENLNFSLKVIEDNYNIHGEPMLPRDITSQVHVVCLGRTTLVASPLVVLFCFLMGKNTVYLALRNEECLSITNHPNISYHKETYCQTILFFQKQIVLNLD